jgi:hypothetical protein
VFDGREKVFNVSSEHPTFLLRKLPSDTILVVRVSERERKKKSFPHAKRRLLAFQVPRSAFATSARVKF